jgi:hypothetical protein
MGARGRGSRAPPCGRDSLAIGSDPRDCRDLAFPGLVGACAEARSLVDVRKRPSCQHGQRRPPLTGGPQPRTSPIRLPNPKQW